MKRIVIVMCWLMPFFVTAQDKASINFSKVSSWSQLIAEAKEKNKPIFIDAYATWCGPCKQMDKEVFSNSEVAEYINRNFVALKVQMDETKNDDAFTQQWLKEAEHFKSYVSAYPCYLFYTASGEYAGRKEGAYPAKEFLAILTISSDENNSYFAKIKRFRAGELNELQTLSLAYEAKENKDTLANTIAKEYKLKYYDQLPVDSLLTASSIKFSISFYQLFGSKDRLVKFLGKNLEKADSIYYKNGYSGKFIYNQAIVKDYVHSQIYEGEKLINENPDWKNIEKAIARDFDPTTAKRMVFDEKINLAFKLNKNIDAVKYEFEKIQEFGLDTSGFGRVYFNNRMYGIVFKTVDDQKILKRATELMQQIVELENHESTSHLDTYASLLYKTGKKSKAIEIENMALEQAKAQNNDKNIQFYSEMIERMKKGDQIWK